MTLTTDAPTIDGPGVYTEIPESDYHAHRESLSVSGAKKLLPPSCPALFRFQQDNPPESTAAFDLGKAAHRIVLGVGAELVVVEADDWRGKAARQQRDEVRAAGHCPLLPSEMAQAQAMADAIRAHPLAAALFSGEGTPEASVFFTDPETGILRRGRLDYLPASRNGRLVIPDLKTAKCAEPRAFARDAATYGYAQQAAWYVDAVKALGLAEDAAFVFVVVEKTPPHLVSVVELDPADVRVGRELNRRAIDVYLECVQSGEWPGYASDVVRVSLPSWYAYRLDEVA